MYTYFLKKMTVLSWVNFYLESVKFLFFAKYRLPDDFLAGLHDVQRAIVVTRVV